MKRHSFKMAAAAVTACMAAGMLLYGCPGQVSLNVNVTPGGSGTVTIVPDRAAFPAGAVVQLTANPSAAWRFNRWEGPVSNPDLASTSITLDQNETVTAVFEQILQDGFRLSAETTPSSTLANITLDPSPDPDTGFYRSGTVVTMTADTTCCPGTGTFVRWEGPVANPNDPVTTVTMNEDQSVLAVVRPQNAPDFTINVAPLLEGSGTVNVTPNQNVFFAGEIGHIEAVPAEGNKFAFWLGDVRDIIGQTTTFTATKNASIFAVFKPESGIPETPHAYLFGIPEGPLADQIEQQFPNVVTEIGTAARGLVMPGSATATIQGNETDRAALWALFNAGFPIVLVTATPDQISALEEVLGVDQSQVDMLPGEELLAYFGIDMEPDGNIWRLVGHMPQPGDTDTLPDFDAWRVQCISTLEAWVLKDNHRADDFPGVEAAAKSALKQGYEDLTKLAQVTPLQIYYFLTFSDTQKSDAFALTTFPYSVHSLTGSGMDFFYIAQYGTFSGAGSYKYTEYDVINEAVRYLYEYRMWTQVTGFDAADANITLYGPTPVTYTGSNTTVTSGITWSIGGSVGINTASGPTFNITSGVQVTNSYTISIPDVAVNLSVTGFNQPQWKYDIRRAYENSKMELSLPPLVAQGTFAPINQWLFVVEPTVRSTYPDGLPLTISFEADESNDQLSCYFGPVNGQLYCSFHQSTSRRMSASQAFTVAWPPASP